MVHRKMAVLHQRGEEDSIDWVGGFGAWPSVRCSVKLEWLAVGMDTNIPFYAWIGEGLPRLSDRADS